MKNITYRLAENNKKDIDYLYDLGVFFEEYNKQHSTRPEEHFLGNWQTYFKEEIIESLKVENSWVHLSFHENKPISFIYSRICKDCYKFVIEELFVLEEYRKEGVGTKLLKLALDIGKKTEYPIMVEVFDWNNSAAEFYKKNGFVLDSYVFKLSL